MGEGCHQVALSLFESKSSNRIEKICVKLHYIIFSLKKFSQAMINICKEGATLYIITF